MFDPKTLKYQKSHEYLAPDGTVGISDHAQKEITDVVFVEPPKLGRTVKQGEACCVVESVKAAFDIYAPVSGEIVAVNAEAAKNPAIVNSEPYGKGWLFKIKASAPRESDVLMNAADYETFLSTEAANGSH
ncbi:MAG: glycine cleavage system protein GcvH [Elusimicrobia bacterium]|nr:glycine cleavage system protein GcvH [Elusimicrobiota bacterium]MDE2511060.1 glycine cleavage system protein GcvH [Elusimicrobiota bacterium]